MACITWQMADGKRYLVAEGKAHTPPAGAFNTGIIDWGCNGLAQDNLEALWTKDGLMVGNLIKKVTTAVGIQQCMSCKGRQRSFNAKGLAVQKKIKDLF